MEVRRAIEGPSIKQPAFGRSQLRRNQCWKRGGALCSDSPSLSYAVIELCRAMPPKVIWRSRRPDLLSDDVIFVPVPG